MLPIPSAHDGRYGFLVDAVAGRDNRMGRGARGIGGSDVSDLLFGQSGLVVLGSSRSVMSALRDAILDVVFGVAEKQVLGVRTGRIVAAMKNEQAVLYRAVVEFVRELVRRVHTASKAAVTNAVASIGAGPLPASVRVFAFDDVAPESLGGWHRIFLAGYQRRDMLWVDAERVSTGSYEVTVPSGMSLPIDVLSGRQSLSFKEHDRQPGLVATLPQMTARLRNAVGSRFDCFFKSHGFNLACWPMEVKL